MNLPSYKKSLVWFRRDLRIEDNNALAHAAYCSEEVYPVFVFDSNILDKLPKNDLRLSFIQESLDDMRVNLKEKGSDLIVLHGDPKVEIPKIATSLGVGAVFTNRDYEVYAKQRDQDVQKKLKNIAFHTFKDIVIFESHEVKNQSDDYYKVFTPYKNQWLKQLFATKLEIKKVNHKKWASEKQISSFLTDISAYTIGFQPTTNVVKGGRKEALKLWKSFQKHIEEYKEQRDFPNLEATSFLSPHLRFGTISIRELVLEVYGRRGMGVETWLSELVWRDFYHMILDAYPHVNTEAFKQDYNDIKWPGKKQDFEAWCEGMTGYPIVDAAMRYFKKTGWMHNRLRMVVAMFLTKDLLINWKEGEAYFASLLLDFDKAANNGGWQWSASTGCDAQPYFRIFNPVSQSERFDPKGEFIRRHLPELKDFPDKYIHAPHEAPDLVQKMAKCEIGKDYPAPIVDHSKQRLKAIELFKK
jgi:deoxyribodipyrimidine photo-lyase